MNDQIEGALEMLNNGMSATIKGLRLTLITSQELEVAGWSQFTSLENLTRTIIDGELSELKNAFSELTRQYPELSKSMFDKTIVYNVYYDDYGKTSILICSEFNGIIEWAIDLI
jgi:hypothetical protein